MLYLSWLPAWNTPFNPAAHAREDEFCLQGSIYEQEEGDIVISGFEVEIPNPGLDVAFIGRAERYAVLSEKLASDNMAVELARGRVVSVPSELGQQTLTLRFQCVPPDEDVVLKAAANALRTGEVAYDPDGPASARQAAESYDALFHSRDASDDPMSALAGRLELWRWDRKTLAIERVSMNAGATTHAVGKNGFEDSLSVALRNPPKKRTRMRVVAAWTQVAKGVQTYPVLYEPIDTYSFEDLMQSLPQPGTPVGDNTGWSVAESFIQYHSMHGLLDEFDVSKEKFVLNDPDVAACKILLQPATVAPLIRLAYDFEQQREELLTISMPVAQQDVLGDDKTETVDVIHLAPLNLDPSTPLWVYEDPSTLEPKEYAVDDEVIYNGRKYRCLSDHTARPDFDFTRWQWVERKGAVNPISAGYFSTNRGVRSARYAIRMLHRRVLQRARCLEVSFRCEWQLARSMSCRDACTVENRKIGEVSGKISSIKLVAAGSERFAEITLLACLGDGTPPPAAGPWPDEETGGVVYNMTYPNTRNPTLAPSLPAKRHRVEIYNDYAEQKMAAMYQPDPVSVIEKMPTRVEISVDPIREEDLITRQLSVVCKPIWLPRDAIVGG